MDISFGVRPLSQNDVTEFVWADSENEDLCIVSSSPVSHSSGIPDNMAVFLFMTLILEEAVSSVSCPYVIQ